MYHILRKTLDMWWKDGLSPRKWRSGLLTGDIFDQGATPKCVTMCFVHCVWLVQDMLIVPIRPRHVKWRVLIRHVQKDKRNAWGGRKNTSAQVHTFHILGDHKQMRNGRSSYSLLYEVTILSVQFCDRNSLIKTAQWAQQCLHWYSCCPALQVEQCASLRKVLRAKFKLTAYTWSTSAKHWVVLSNHWRN